MTKKYGLVLAGITALVLMGAGCSGGKTDQSNSDSGAYNNTNDDDKTASSAKVVFNKANNLTFTNDATKALDNKIRMVVTDVFGPAKLTGFSNDETNNTFYLREYTVSRLATAEDVTVLVAALKANGFKVSNSFVNETSGIVNASFGQNELTFAIFTNEQKIQVSVNALGVGAEQ